MKRCPHCERTYADETITFCLVDGALLSAPYDPEAPRPAPATAAAPIKQPEPKPASDKVWADERIGDEARSFNLNQGKAVRYSATDNFYSTRAFAVREARN